MDKWKKGEHFMRWILFAGIAMIVIVGINSFTEWYSHKVADRAMQVEKSLPQKTAHKKGLDLPYPDPSKDVVIVFGSIWDDCLIRWAGPGWDTCLRPDGEVTKNGVTDPDAVEFWQALADAYPNWHEQACRNRQIPSSKEPEKR